MEKDVTEAALAGINSTPGIIINGFYLSGTPSLTHLEEVITAIENGQTSLAEDLPSAQERSTGGDMQGGDGKKEGRNYH